MFCMKCGMEIQDKWTVCPQCAEPLPCRAAARPAPPPPRPAVPPPRPATAPPSVPRAQKPGVSVAAVIVCSLVLGLGLLSVFHRTSRRTEDPANRSAEDPVAIQNRILAGSHDGYLKALNGKSPVASPPPVATSTSAGEYVIVYKPWPCGSSKDALSEITKWAVRNDTREMAIAMARTGSALLIPGTRIKILDTGIMSSKVRIVRMGDLASSGLSGSSKYYGFSGQECWVHSEAVR